MNLAHVVGAERLIDSLLALRGQPHLFETILDGDETIRFLGMAARVVTLKQGVSKKKGNGYPQVN